MDSISWSWVWGTDSLILGENFLCAVALDSQIAGTNNPGSGTPFTGNVTVYPVYRLKELFPPETPILISPGNGAVDQPTPVTFLWHSSARAQIYNLQVQLATDSTFSFLYSPPPVNLYSPDTSSLHTLWGTTKYYWRVRAGNGDGYSGWSSVWNFSTAAEIPPPPSTPVLSSPANNTLGVSTNPLLSWNAAAGAASYTVQVSTDSIFSALTVNDSGITGTSHVAAGLSTFTLYYWRVRAVNAGGASGWSTVWNFITGSTAVLPSNPSAPRAFSFAGSSGVVRYSLPKQCRVSLKYYDLRGRLATSLINTMQGPGYYVLSIKNSLPSKGLYVRVFEAGSFINRELVATMEK
jgi:hypothetical protein